MKTLLSVLSLVLCLVCFGQSQVSAANSLQLNVNGSLLADLPSPLVKKNVSYVPIRTAGSLGYTVVWDSASKTVSIINRTTSDRLVLKVGSNIAIKNKEEVKLDTPPLIKSNTIYVPLDLLANILGRL